MPGKVYTDKEVRILLDLCWQESYEHAYLIAMGSYPEITKEQWINDNLKHYGDIR